MIKIYANKHYVNDAGRVVFIAGWETDEDGKVFRGLLDDKSLHYYCEMGECVDIGPDAGDLVREATIDEKVEFNDKLNGAIALTASGDVKIIQKPVKTEKPMWQIVSEEYDTKYGDW